MPFDESIERETFWISEKDREAMDEEQLRYYAVGMTVYNLLPVVIPHKGRVDTLLGRLTAIQIGRAILTQSETVFSGYKEREEKDNE